MAKFPTDVKFDDVNIDTQINVVSNTESVSGKRNVVLGDQLKTIVDLRTVPLTETQDRAMQVFLNNIKKYGLVEMDLSELGIFKPIAEVAEQLKVTYGKAPTYAAASTGANTINVDSLGAGTDLPVGVGSYIQLQEGDGTIRDKLYLITAIDTIDTGYKLTFSPTLDSSLISQPILHTLRNEIDYTFNTSDQYTYRDENELEFEGRSTYIFSNAQGNVATYTYAADGSETYVYSGNLTDTYVFESISYNWDENQSFAFYSFSDVGTYTTWTRGSLATTTTYTQGTPFFALSAPGPSSTTIGVEGFSSAIVVGARIGYGTDSTDPGSLILTRVSGFDGWQITIEEPIAGADGTDNQLYIIEATTITSSVSNLEIQGIEILDNSSRVTVIDSGDVTTGDYLSLNNDNDALQVIDTLNLSATRSSVNVLQQGTPTLTARNIGLSETLFGTNLVNLDTSEVDWLEIPNIPGATTTSDPFTVEMFWIPGAINIFTVPFSLVGTRSTNYSTIDLWYESARGEWQSGYNNVWSNRQTTNNGTAPVVGTPIHLAFVYSGTAGKFYVDGTEVTEIAGGVLTDALSDMTLIIGGTYYSPTGTTLNQNYYASGQYDNIRVSNIARYTANFTAPTTQFENDDDTVLLIDGENDSLTDNTGGLTVRTPVTINRFGFPSVGTPGRFDDNNVFLNSVVANSYLRADGALSNFTSTSDPFTIEFWYNPTSFASNAAYIANIGINTTSNGSNNVLIGHTLSNGIYYTVNSTDYVPSTVTNYNFTDADSWVYVALSFDGTTFRFFIDGNLRHTQTVIPSTPLSQCVLGIGVEYDSANGGSPGNYSRGIYDDIRISNTAKYTASFTAPTAALVNEDDTVFLLNGNSGDLVDEIPILQDYVEFAETTLPSGWQTGVELYIATGFTGYQISNISGSTYTLNNVTGLNVGDILTNDRTQFQDNTNRAAIDTIVGNDITFTSTPSSFVIGDELFTRTTTTPQIEITAVNGLDITVNGIGDLVVGDIIDAGTVSTLENGHTITAINTTTNVITLATIDDNFIVGAEISLRTGTSNAAYTVVSASGTTLTLAGSPATGRAGNVGIDVGDFIGVSTTDTNPYEVISGPTANGSDFDYTLGRTIDNINANDNVFVGTDTDRTLTITAIDYAANTITFDVDPITLGVSIGDRLGLNPPRTGTTRFYVIVGSINGNTITTRGDISNAENRLQIGDILQTVTTTNDSSITILDRDDTIANFSTLTVDNTTDANGDSLRVGDLLVVDKNIVSPNVSISAINGNEITINRPPSGFSVGQEIFIATEDFRRTYLITAINANTVTIDGSRLPTANLAIGDFVSLGTNRFDGPGREITAVTDTQITLSNVSGLSVGNSLVKVTDTITRFYTVQSSSNQTIVLDKVDNLLVGDEIGFGTDFVTIASIDTNANSIDINEASVPTAFVMGVMLQITSNIIPASYTVSAVNGNELTLDSTEDLAIGDYISNTTANAQGAEISAINAITNTITLVVGHGITFAVNDTIYKQLSFAAGTYTIGTITGQGIGLDTISGLQAGQQIGNDDGVVTISSVNAGDSITVSGTIPNTWTINTEIFVVALTTASQFEISMVDYDANTLMLDSTAGLMIGDVYSRSADSETITITNINNFTNTITVNNLPDTYVDGDIIQQVLSSSNAAQAEIKHDNLTGTFRVEDGNWNSTSSYIGSDGTQYKTYRFRLIEEL